MTDTWASNSNDAVSISMIGSPSCKAFSPEFTYPIFGESETIYGYSKPNIHLKFPSNVSTSPLLTISYESKNESTTAQIDDLETTLKEFLPQDYFNQEKQDEWETLRKRNFNWKPLGELVKSYQRKRKDKGKGKKSGLFSSTPSSSASGTTNGNSDDQRCFEIFKSTWQTPGFKEFHRRIQIFALFYIEGASYLEEDEPNWEFYTLFEKVGESYHFIGYTSIYTFYFYPDSSRVRLSQFLILPTYQKEKHGSELYNLVLQEVRSRERVQELTVEDPSEAFDRLRDTNDLRWLLRKGGLVEDWKSRGILKAPIDKAESEKDRKKNKIAPRQWSRLLELVLLLSIDSSDSQQIKALRLSIKARIYKKNKDVLMDLSPEMRKEKLQETYEGLLEAEYGPLTGVEVEPFLGPRSEANGLDDDDNDDEEEQGGGSSRKKARFA